MDFILSIVARLVHILESVCLVLGIAIFLVLFYLVDKLGFDVEFDS